jgi:putative ABC transport system permease protein
VNTAYRRKILRDFWQQRTRSALVVAAIALGISAFTTVLSAYAILTRELNNGYLATNPASATLWTDAVDDELLRALASLPGVAELEARRSLRGRLKAGPVEWRNLQLFVVKDYESVRVSTLTPQQGASSPRAGEILIERDALQVARARIGGSVTVKTANGTERTLRVSGTVADVGQAQARMEQMVYGYITLETLSELGEEPYLDQIKLLVSGDRLDADHVRRVAGSVSDALAARGRPVRRVEVPKPGQHPHADLMGLLLLVKAAFGLFALALSGILVVNLLTALMAAQVRQIGVMKAVGGTRAQIASIYFAQALLLGVAAAAAGLPAGIWGGRVLTRYMAVFLNFDITSFALPAWVYLLVGVSALLVPLLAAAYPVAKGVSLSTREALADFGVAAFSFGRTRLDRALAGIGGIGRPVLFAIRNSFRRRVRLALTLATLAIAGVFFLAALNTRASMINTIDRLFASRRFDLAVTLGQMYPLERLTRAVRAAPGIARVEGWIATEATLASGGATGRGVNGGHGASAGRGGALRHGGGAGSAVHDTALGDRFTVVALPALTELLRPEIVEGRGLRAEDENALVINNQLAARLPRLRVGTDVVLRMGPAETPFRVVGIVREAFSPAVAYAPLRFFEARGHANVTNSLRLVLERRDPQSLAAVRDSLDRSFESAGIRALGTTTNGERRKSFDEHMLMIYMFLIIVSVILVAVGGLGLSTTMTLNVLERRREMGVLRAIGATPRVVFLIVAAEGAAVGLMSWALAAAAAWPASRALGGLLVRLMFRSGLDYVYEPIGLLIWLLVAVGLGIVASVLPAWHAARSPVREALAYE